MKSQSETQKFVGDVAWVALAQVLVGLTGLVTLPALTKSYPAEIYGVWAQMAVTVGLLTPIVTLHLTTAMVRFLAGEEDRDERRRALGAMLWPVVAFASLAVVASVALRQDLSVLLFAGPEYAPLVPLTFAWVAMEALFAISLSYLRARGKIKRFSLMQIALAAVKMAVIVVLATRGYSLAWVIAVFVAGEAVLVAAILAMIVRETGLPGPTLTRLRHFLSFSLPQIPSGALLWVIAASDRYFITHLLDLSQTAVYSASYTLGSLIQWTYVPLGLVLLPSVSRFWEREEFAKTRSYFEYSTRLFLTLAVPAVAGLYVLSQPLLGLLTTGEYMAGGILVLLVAIGTVFLGIYQINVYVVLLTQRTQWLPLMIGLAAAVNAGINMALIPGIGIMAAAISTVVSCFVLAAIVTVWARRVISYGMDLRFVGKVMVSAVVMAVCLRLMPVTSGWQLVLAIVSGAAMYALGLWLLKALSAQDRKLVKEIAAGLGPGRPR